MTVDKKKVTLTGQVIRVTEKTVAVLIKDQVRDPFYGKYISRTRKILAHNNFSDVEVGKYITVQPCRPISKKKTWMVVEVLNK